MHAALSATRGIAFHIDFLTGILLRQMYQARELTILLESKDAGLAFAPPARGGSHS